MKKLLLLLLCVPLIGFSQKLSIGDTYQGGIIFHLYESGAGLIVAPTDQSPSAEWGCYGITISGADDTYIGAGIQNTIDIESGCTTPNTAADICANLNINGYRDWFLPSIVELNKIYVNLNKKGLGDFIQSNYWSSTEDDSGYAKNLNFSNGNWYNGNKNDNNYVRAIRFFGYELMDKITTESFEKGMNLFNLYEFDVSLNYQLISMTKEYNQTNDYELYQSIQKFKEDMELVMNKKREEFGVRHETKDYYDKAVVYLNIAMEGYSKAINLNHELSKSYINRGIIKEKLDLNYCLDYKKACDLGIVRSCEWYYKKCK